jgi:hypothetical protein
MTLRRITQTLAATTLVIEALATTILVIALGTTGGAQFGPAQSGGGNGPESQVVAKYDKDGDGRLNRGERAIVRASLGSIASARPARRGRGGAAPTPGAKLTPADVRPPYPGTNLYDLGTLRTIFLQFDEPDWESELSFFFNSDVEVPATMTVDGRTYRDVGVHFRGASSFRNTPEGYKRSLNLAVDFVHGNQDLGSYQTLNLLNANNDATFLRGVLYTEISRRFIPTPKMNFVRVAINGESWGVYLNAQQFNGDFIRENFKPTGGDRWKAPGSPRGRAGLEYLGEDIAAYKQIYEIKTKDNPEAWTALMQLCQVLNTTPPDRLEAALSPLLNIDGVLRFMAVEIALANPDGYWTRASDYNLYRDTAGRFHLIPHDVNEALGGEGGARRAQLDPLAAVGDPTKPLYSKLLAVPALREKYLGYVREIAEKWLDWDAALLPIAQAGHNLIAADVLADTRKLSDNAGFSAGVSVTGALKNFIDTRRAFLLTATSPARAAR